VIDIFAAFHVSRRKNGKNEAKTGDVGLNARVKMKNFHLIGSILRSAASSEPMRFVESG